MSLTASDPQRQRAVVEHWLEVARDDATLDVYGGKRSVLRYDWVCPMELLVAGQIHFVYSFNITPVAMGITGRMELRRGEIVGIRHDESEDWVQASVVHTTESLAGYKVGLKFLI